MSFERCGAKKTQGGICKQPAGHGTGHVGVGRCKFHGGATPTHEKAGAEEIMRRGHLWYGDPVDVEPHVALLQEVYRTAGHVAHLQREVGTREINTDDTAVAKAEIAVLRDLYKRERTHLVTVCQVALNAGVQERQVQLAEKMGELIAPVLAGILEDLDLTPKQRKSAPEVIGRHLRVLEGGVAA